MTAAYRQLYMFQQLLSDHILNKAALADKFQVTPRVIQSDISQIKSFIQEQQLFYELTYHRQLGGYRLDVTQDSLSKQAVLVLIKVMLASRSLNSVEIKQTITSLLNLIPAPEQRQIQPIIKNELFYYRPVSHDKPLLTLIWQFSQFIITKTTLEITYRNQLGHVDQRIILPQAIIFSEYYFYVVAYSQKYQANRFFRLDRIENYTVSSEKLTRSRAERVEDGALRQVIHYMQPGERMTIQFEFRGIVEAALDRFPTATIKARYPERHSVLIEADVFDKGAKMWLLSQGALVTVKAPSIFVHEIHDELIKALATYRNL
ncbi:MAG TPA: WYL domain-containing protein [Candidatus Levilactobacillus faecigallinarum]|uniref:WYL domain-containing protein n=1 Tax=Candidatus Levilactobacillus faecigallinarum TaxID=2838638 RepID=A0A9D1U569_9LACO|nr:WYL domain-containing protein [Candidatus Levilactobacillus faecigallinarum]